MSSESEEARKSLLKEIQKLNSSENKARGERRTTVRVARESIPPINLQPVLQKITGNDLKVKLKPLVEPLDKPKAKRIQRAAGFEDVTVDVNRWDGIVNQRRKEDQLSFPLERVDCRLVTTERNFRPSLKSDLEKEVYGLLKGAKLVEEKQETEEEATIRRAMSLEEIKSESKRMARDRRLKQRLEKKAALLNKSKSRKYHKIVRREKLKIKKQEFETLKMTNPEAAVEILNDIEKTRLRERMDLRHKNSKWLKIQGQRCGKDAMVRDLLKENSDMRKELLEKLQNPQQSTEDSDEDDESDILKNQEDAINSGKFDSGNAWVKQLAITRKEEDPDESFDRMKRFWEQVQETKKSELQAQEIVNKWEQKKKQKKKGDAEKRSSANATDNDKEEGETDVNDDEMKQFWDRDKKGKDLGSNADDETGADEGVVSSKKKRKGNAEEKIGEEEGNLEKKRKGTVERKSVEERDKKTADESLECLEEAEHEMKEEKNIIKKDKFKKKKNKVEEKVGANKVDKLNEKKKEVEASKPDVAGKEMTEETIDEMFKKLENKMKKKLIKKSERKVARNSNCKKTADESLECLEEAKHEMKEEKNRIKKDKFKKKKNKVGEKVGANKVDKLNEKKKEVEASKPDLAGKEMTEETIDEMFKKLENKMKKKLIKKSERKVTRNSNPLTTTKPRSEIVSEQQLEIQKTSSEVTKKVNTKIMASNESTDSNAEVKDPLPSSLPIINDRRLGTARPDYAFLRRKIENESDDEDSDEGFEDIFDNEENIKLFEEEKKAHEENTKPKDIDGFLPGWGRWAGPGIVPSKERRRRFRIKAPKPQANKFTKIGNVIYNEKNDVHDNLRKMMVSQLPYPFTTVKDFEASIRQPISSTFVPEVVHKKLIAPPVVHKMGQMIYPMNEECLIKEHEKKKKSSNLEKKLNEELGFRRRSYPKYRSERNYKTKKLPVKPLNFG